MERVREESNRTKVITAMTSRFVKDNVIFIEGDFFFLLHLSLIGRVLAPSERWSDNFRRGRERGRRDWERVVGIWERVVGLQREFWKRKPQCQLFYRVGTPQNSVINLQQVFAHTHTNIANFICIDTVETDSPCRLEG